METKQLHLNINLNNYYHQFNEEISSHFVSLKSILKCINDDSYLAFTEIKIGSGGKMPISKLDKVKFKQQELNKTFISIIRSFQNFVDRLVAIIDLCSKNHVAQKSINSEEELQEYLNYMEGNSIQEISLNRELTFPKKLNYFEIEESTKQCLLGYGLLRNNLEHHKDIASKDTKFSYLIPVVYINGKEIIKLPYHFNKGDILQFGVKVVEREINKGSQVKISEEDINEITFTLGKVIAHNLIIVTNQKLTKKY